MEWNKEGYILSDNSNKIDINKVHKMLLNTYWASDRTIEQFKTAIKNSLCFSIHNENEQIGFARVVGDETTYSWICDVIIDENYQRKNLGKWLIKCILEHPKVEKTKQHLATKDAQGLYEKYGFKKTETMKRLDGIKS